MVKIINSHYPHDRPLPGSRKLRIGIVVIIVVIAASAVVASGREELFAALLLSVVATFVAEWLRRPVMAVVHRWLL